ncbi:nitrilase-related carbon-nitrogen hydrolase [Bacillus sp. SL00103]
MICYDLRFPQPSRTLVNKGAKVLINTAQWPAKKIDHWRKFCSSQEPLKISHL